MNREARQDRAIAFYGRFPLDHSVVEEHRRVDRAMKYLAKKDYKRYQKHQRRVKLILVFSYAVAAVGMFAINYLGF